MSVRTQAARAYLSQLLAQYKTLEAEKAALQAAASRIPAIDAEQSDIIADAQAALTKYNALEGTSYTLQQVRALLDPTPAQP